MREFSAAICGMSNFSHQARPLETRDQEESAEAYYQHPLRVRNRILSEENLRLKRLLRENNISYSTDPQPSPVGPPRKRPRTRAAAAARLPELVIGDKPLPWLPPEVCLRILDFAMTSPEPIVDPLSKPRPENMPGRPAANKAVTNNIAIHALAACRTFLEEGRRSLWANNTFIFTDAQTLLNFQELELKYRLSIKHITLRIVARFYDDTKRRHNLPRLYHPLVTQEIPLRVTLRPKEHPLARSGFRSYSWSQLVDFLSALRPPFQPGPRVGPRPLLLPNLNSMTIDFVNFGPFTLTDFDRGLHEVAAHDLGYTLDRLSVTGLPIDEFGSRASNDLSGMLRDGGLYIKGLPAFVALKSWLKPLPTWPSDPRWAPCMRVVRGSRMIKARKEARQKAAAETAAIKEGHGRYETRRPSRSESSSQSSRRTCAVDEPGPGRNKEYYDDTVIWKQVPKPYGKPGELQWIQFNADVGLPVEMCNLDADDDDIDYCHNCGLMHPYGAFSYLL